MPRLDLNYRIPNAVHVQGRLVKFSNDVVAGLRRQAQVRARDTVNEYKSQMGAEYTSRWATGLLAAGIRFRTTSEAGGVKVSFYIQDRRELEFVTALFGGYFQHFPVGPFAIWARQRKALAIRSTVLGLNRAGGLTAAGRVRGFMANPVLWGSETGGFRRDVIAEVTEQEGQAFVEDMEEIVREAIVELTSGG